MREGRKSSDRGERKLDGQTPCYSAPQRGHYLDKQCNSCGEPICKALRASGLVLDSSRGLRGRLLVRRVHDVDLLLLVATAARGRGRQSLAE
jgi:hypothetical protein